MHHRKILAAVCAICAAAIAAHAPCARAFATASGPDTTKAGAVIDRIVATVEDHAIFQSEVDNEIRNILVQTQRTSLPPDEEKEMRKEALNSLIATALITIQADRDNMKIEDRDLNEAMDRLIEQKKTEIGGDEAFERQLAAEGLTLDALRERYRENVRTLLIIDKIRHEKMLPDVKVTDAEVRDYYKAHLSEIPQKEPTVSIAHILIVPKPTDAVLAKALDKITMVGGKLKAGGDFAALAKEYSDCPSAKFGGNLGTLNLDDLHNPPFADAARKVTVGQVGGPVLTEFGYHLIKIEKVEGDQVTLRHILVRAVPTPEDIEAASKLAGRVRTEIAGGADFAAEAAKYSGDYGTKDKGGVFGEVKIKDLPDQFKEAIKGVPVGGLAPVMKEDRGFRVVKILGRNDAGTYSYDEVKSQVRRLLVEQKVMEKMNAYVEELKKSYSVVIKGE
jgi:peptidyl-prolyl cis-trans isomerase SurA